LIALIGNGVLGSELKKLLINCDCKQFSRSNGFDLKDTVSNLKTILNRKNNSELRSPTINYVINAASYTKVDLAESEREEALQINAYGPAKLAQICAYYGATFMQISTDFVFDGRRSVDKPYTEEDMPNPINWYGHTKLLGEKLIKESGCKHAIVRTSKLYNNTNGFIHRLINKIKSEKRLSGVKDQIFSPTHGTQLAAQIIEIIDNRLFGVFHATCLGKTSAYDLIKYLVSKLNSKTEIDESTLFNLYSSARRPQMCLLSNKKLQSFGNYIMGDWQEPLNRFFM
jgi:dTDP-4-dehydrorhamnose reductase